MPFRRLLLIENIVDLGDVTVSDSMRHRSGVRSIRLDAPWEDNLKLVRETSFSRYPLVENDSGRPIGVLHVKDLFLHADGDAPDADDLRKLARPCSTLREDLPLDDALTRFQRAYHHFAIVNDMKGEWSGIITIEDVLEELVGKIGDEFDAARSGQFVSLADALTPGRVVFGVQGESLVEAVRDLLARVPEGELPGDRQTILHAVLQREAQMATYLGHGLAIPHCRLDRLTSPVLVFGRSENGIPTEGSNDRIELIFLLLTPGRMARIQPRLLADIVGLIESDYVTERLKKDEKPEDVIEAIRDGQQVVLD